MQEIEEEINLANIHGLVSLIFLIIMNIESDVLFCHTCHRAVRENMWIALSKLIKHS